MRKIDELMSAQALQYIESSRKEMDYALGLLESEEASIDDPEVLRSIFSAYLLLEDALSLAGKRARSLNYIMTDIPHQDFKRFINIYGDLKKEDSLDLEEGAFLIDFSKEHYIELSALVENEIWQD